MKKLLRIFRREKGLRYPNGIPRVEITDTLNRTNWGTQSDRPWVIFEDGDDK